MATKQYSENFVAQNFLHENKNTFLFRGTCVILQVTCYHRPITFVACQVALCGVASCVCVSEEKIF